MIGILLRGTALTMVCLLLVKGIVSFENVNIKFADRFAYNLKDKYVWAAVAWLCLVELVLFQVWADSMQFAYTVKDNAYVGIVVIVLWMWTLTMCVITPCLAGWRGWRAAGIAAVLMIAESVGVLMLL